MKSVLELTDRQKADFRLLADDVRGPCMVAWCLGLLERVAFSLADPDKDPSWLESVEDMEDFDTAMTSLEYFRMQIVRDDE